VISRTQSSVPDNAQHSQETDLYAPRGIRTRNPSHRAAAKPRLRPHGYRDRQNNKVTNYITQYSHAIFLSP